MGVGAGVHRSKSKLLAAVAVGASLVFVAACNSSAEDGAKASSSNVRHRSTPSSSASSTTTSVAAAESGVAGSTSTTIAGSSTTQVTARQPVATTVPVVPTTIRVDNTFANQQCKQRAEAMLDDALNEIAYDQADLNAQYADLVRRGLSTSGMAASVQAQLAQIAPRTDAAYAEYDAALGECDAIFPI